MSNQKNKEPYLIDKFSKIPSYVKIGFLKFWISGALFLFIINGLKIEIFDKIAVLYLVLVLAYEYLVFPLIKSMNYKGNDTKKYLLHEFRSNSVFSLILTAIFVLIIIIISFFTLEFLVRYLFTFGMIMSESDADPISFGLIFLFYDYIIIKIRQLIKYLKSKGDKNVQNNLS